MPRAFASCVFLVLLFWSCLIAADSKDQFKTWYHEFGPTFEAIMEGNCSDEYEKYLTVPKKDAPIDWFTGGGNTNRLAQPVTNCILGHTSEFILSNMAAAAVVLGLMPTILATVGNSVEETSTLCVLGQRPFLALILAAGSPAIFPTRSFEYLKPMKLVRPRRYRLRTKKDSIPRGMILVVEYLFAVAIIINTYTLCNQLGVMVVSMLAPHLTYLEFLWSIIGVAIHLSAACSLWARTRMREEEYTWGQYIWDVACQQFKPIDEDVWTRAEITDDTPLSMFLSYFTSLLGTCHVIYGSMLFSSLVFISSTDSLTVLARYMASAMASRVILMYEIFWLRDIIGGRDDIRLVTESNESTELGEIMDRDGKIYRRGTADSRICDS